MWKRKKKSKMSLKKKVYRRNIIWEKKTKKLKTQAHEGLEVDWALVGFGPNGLLKIFWLSGLKGSDLVSWWREGHWAEAQLYQRKAQEKPKSRQYRSRRGSFNGSYSFIYLPRVTVFLPQRLHRLRNLFDLWYSIAA